MHVVLGGNGSLGRLLAERSGEERLLVIDKMLRSEAPYEQLERDLTAPDSLSDMDWSAYPKIDKVSVLTGVNYGRGLLDISPEEWDTMFGVNVKGSLFAIRALLPQFAKDVSIVLCGSQNGVVGHEDRIGYGESKAALIHLAKNLTVEFAKMKERDIRVNAVSPSYILNEDTRVMLEETVQGELLRNKIPNRHFIHPECVVSTIQFLHSEGAVGIRGQNIVIDNGMTVV